MNQQLYCSDKQSGQKILILSQSLNLVCLLKDSKIYFSYLDGSKNQTLINLETKLFEINENHNISDFRLYENNLYILTTKCVFLKVDFTNIKLTYLYISPKHYNNKESNILFTINNLENIILFKNNENLNQTNLKIFDYTKKKNKTKFFTINNFIVKDVISCNKKYILFSIEKILMIYPFENKIFNLEKDLCSSYLNKPKCGYFYDIHNLYLVNSNNYIVLIDPIPILIDENNNSFGQLKKIYEICPLDIFYKNIDSFEINQISFLIRKLNNSEISIMMYFITNKFFGYFLMEN